MKRVQGYLMQAFAPTTQSCTDTSQYQRKRTIATTPDLLRRAALSDQSGRIILQLIHDARLVRPVHAELVDAGELHIAPVRIDADGELI